MIRCYFCRKQIAHVHAALEADWCPWFYDGDREISGPVCPACTSARLRLRADGELELAESARCADVPAPSVADAIRTVIVKLEKAIDEGSRSRRIDADDLIEVLLAIADELDAPVVVVTEG